MHLLRLSGLIAVAGLLYGQAPARTRVIGWSGTHRRAPRKDRHGRHYSVVFERKPASRGRAREKDSAKRNDLRSDLAKEIACWLAHRIRRSQNAHGAIRDLMSARDIAQKNEKERENGRTAESAGWSSPPTRGQGSQNRIPSMFGQQHS